MRIDDIIDNLNLNYDYELSLKTSPEKRAKITLRKLVKDGCVREFIFSDKTLNYYKYTGNMVKNLFAEIMLSDLRPAYKNEFMLYCKSVMTENNLKILKKQIEINKNFREKKVNLEVSKKKRDYFI